MNRRNFLKLATASAAALAIDPERLLWTPGKRTYFDLWAPPKIEIGDWVFINAAPWGRHRDERGEWIFLRTGDVSRITPTGRGLIGVVTAVQHGDTKVQIYGPVQGAGIQLANPFIAA